MTKKTKKIIGWVIAIIIVLTLIIGNFFVSYALVPSQGAEDREPTADVLPPGVESTDENLENVIARNKEQELQAADEWEESASSVMKEVSISSEEGYQLIGHTYTQQEDTNQWAVVVHGYQASEEMMLPTAHHYYDAGYNVLTFDQRAMDESEGEYITMGIKESDDLILWLEALLAEHPDAEIVTHGRSMGSATVLMASGKDNYPDAVKAIIADCGYDTIWGVFESELYQRFELNEFPFLHMASLVAIPRVGINLFSEEGDVTEYVSHSDTPTLFIHGTADAFVPYPMVYNLYDAHPTEEKDTFIVEGAGHSESQYADVEGYYEKVFNFIEKY